MTRKRRGCTGTIRARPRPVGQTGLGRNCQGHGRLLGIRSIKEVPVDKRSVQGIEELVHAVLDIARNLPEGRSLWFRGLSKDSYNLIPRIMRDNQSSDDVFDREYRLLTRFRQRSIAYWPPSYPHPQSDWEHLFAMQHFGLPTRLLDWSENLFIASYFALLAPHKDSHEGKGNPVVWCVDPVEWNRSVSLLSDMLGRAKIQVLTPVDDGLNTNPLVEYMPNTLEARQGKSPVAMFGTHNSARIVAQRGTFMVWGRDPKPLEDFANERSARLWRIEVSGNRGELAESLRQLGFNETMVFPELPSLSAELIRMEGWKKS